jgi:hypothetical protein
VSRALAYGRSSCCSVDTLSYAKWRLGLGSTQQVDYSRGVRSSDGAVDGCIATDAFESRGINGKEMRD